MNYISFPRKQANHSIWYVKNDGDKCFQINSDIDGEWNLAQLPIIEGRVDSCISIWAIPYVVSFEKCFSNHYVYEYCVYVPEHYEEKMAIVRKYNPEDSESAADYFTDLDAMRKELDVYANNEWCVRNQVLCKYLHDSLGIGEFVELYESWTDHGDENGLKFNSPTSEMVITLKELLSLPYSRDCIGFDERTKLTIHKTE